jgi:two-component system sensor histidine kinase/response regulator
MPERDPFQDRGDGEASDRGQLEGLAAQLAAVVQFSPEAIISKTADGTIASWNPGAEKLYGYTEAEVKGQSITILLPAGHDDEVATLLTRAAAGEIVDHFETVRRRKDGSLVDVLLALSPVCDPTGRVVGVSTVARDITKQKRAERELAQARADIDRFFGLTLDLIAIADSNFQFLRVNPAFERTLGYSPDELLASAFTDFIHPDDLQPTLDRYATQLAGGPVVGIENRYRCKDGSYRWLLWNASAVEDGRIYATARDVTDAKLIEDALHASQAQALDASRLKSEFVANMSHEIRTPLNGVVCMAELMLDTPLNDEQREYANLGLTSAEALMGVINDILDFSKIEAGKLDIVDEDYSIEQTAGAVCEILGIKADEKRVELAVSLEPDVPAVVRGDGNRVRQMLMNLIGNAIKFTAEGEIILHVGIQHSADGELLRFDVTDTGIGIESDRLAELFAPFSQADGTATRRYGGTGLGLSITKQLAELMGGEIGVDSIPEQGSTFWFTLPCVRGTAVDMTEPVRDLTGTRVLIVDDNATNRRIVERQLASWGLIPDSAAAGEAALALMHRAADAGRPYEAAVIDMRMPEMDGLELARAIKATPRLRGARLILLSGAHVLTEDAKAAGIDAVLSKPVRQSMLCNQLVNSLSRAPKPAQSGLAAPQPTPPPTADGAHVLVAEDNEINQIAARRVLRNFGYVVDIAPNGREAIEALGRRDYAVVFMDCQMPEIDGYTATVAIRRREGQRRHTPIIAMTAHTMEGDRDKCLAAGMDDYIAKPIRFANVQTVLGHLFPDDAPPAAPA